MFLIKFYVLPAFLPSLLGTLRHAHPGIKLPPGTPNTGRGGWSVDRAVLGGSTVGQNFSLNRNREARPSAAGVLEHRFQISITLLEPRL